MAKRPVTPREALGSLLVDTSCYSVKPRVWVTPRSVVEGKLQYLAVEILVNDYYIKREPGRGRVAAVDEYGGRTIRIHLGKGDEEYECEIRGDNGEASWRDLEARLPDPPFPLFLVDLGFWRLHTDEEKSRLRIQLSMTLNTVRKFLWDRHLAVTSVQQGVREQLDQVMGSNKAFITSARPAELLWSLGAEEVIILRPDAPEELTARDLEKADAFVIGGIVDLTPRKGVSRVLDRMVPWGVPKKITLRGSTIGVPDRINRIVEIILKAMFVYNGDVERAVVSSMTKRDIARRLFVEVMKRSRPSGGRRVIRESEYYDIVRWLPVSWEDFLEAARKAHVEVVGGEGGDPGG